MAKKYVITDIHGCSQTFRKLVYEIGPEKDDDIYLLGDYIDRGPDSRDVFDFIFELKAQNFRVHCLRGNHEQFLLDALDDMEEFQNWVTRNGGDTTLKSFGANNVREIPRKYLDFVSGLPYYFDIGRFLLVHAGFNFYSSDPFSDKEAMIMIRNFVIDYDILGDRKIIHGHTPTRLSQIVKNLEDSDADVFNLDAGCVYKQASDMNHLVALELEEWKLFVVDCVDNI